MKRIKYVFLVFGFFVAANYFFLAVRSFFQGLVLLPARGGTVAGSTGHPNFYDGLPSVSFDFFKKGGDGWNYVTQGYGRTSFANEYPGDWHDGIDIASAYNAPIYAAAGGTVIAEGNQDDYCYHRAFGKYVAVKDPDGKYVLWYAHLGNITVSNGQTISAGAEIGTIGSTGFETGPHLHFSVFDGSDFTMEVRNGCGPEPTGRDLDPIPYLQSL